MQLLRDEICSEIFKDENKDLHHLLYFGDLLLDPQDWKGLMTQEDDESLHCDLIFVGSNNTQPFFNYCIP